jgi:hypothetical protein
MSGSFHIGIMDGPLDSFSAEVIRDHLAGYGPGKVRIWGPSFALNDDTGGIFSDTSLPDLSLVGGQFTGGTISISYQIDAGSSSSQTGMITSIIPEPSTYALLLISAAGAVCLARRRRK